MQLIYLIRGNILGKWIMMFTFYLETPRNPGPGGLWDLDTGFLKNKQTKKQLEIKYKATPTCL